MRIKTQFVSAVLKETAESIHSSQLRVVKEWSLFDSGDMEKSLKGHFNVQQQDGGGLLTMRYLTYTRFLDMRDPSRRISRDGYHIYNKIVFGTLYNPALNTLRWGLTDDVRAAIGEQLDEIYSAKMPYYKIRDLAMVKIAEQDRNLAAVFSKAMRQGYR